VAKKYKVRIKSPRRSLKEQLQSIVDDYMRETGVESFAMESVAEWAVARGRYRREPISIVKRCKQELARACRAAHYTDPQGRFVRRMHPAKLPFGEDDSIVVWADITKAKPNHMRVSFQQRRQAIVSDAKQHRTEQRLQCATSLVRLQHQQGLG
jgi:hypothetical protein